MIDRARLRALAEAATPGPWEAEIRDGCLFITAIDGNTSVAEVLGPPTHQVVAADATYIAAASPDTVLALLDALDALDAAERERDGANERASQWVRIAGEHGADKDALKSERDALATDARRWRAIDGYWRTAQCYFRKDEKNSIRAMQLHIDFDHPNGRKSLASTIDAALDGAKGAT